MVLNFKKIGIIILSGIIIIAAALVLWPDKNPEKEVLPTEYENTTNENDLLTESAMPLTNDFFAEYRIEREKIRGRQIELLREVLSNSADAESRKVASLRLVRISEDMEKELKAESMIKSKGYSDCVVIMQEETILVVLLEGGMKPDQEEEISDIAEKVTGYNKDDLCIIYRNVR